MAVWNYKFVDPKEFNVYKVLTEGEGSFKVKSVFDKDKDGYPLEDKNGLPKLKLVLNVTDSKGNTSLIDDYLTGSWPARIHEFALGVGLPGLYNAAGVIDTQKLVGLSGGCIIKTDTYNGKDSSKIAAYLVNDNQQILPDDDIPF